ncbi:MtrAB system accessory protein LpqB [Corynebacterium poyangense]|uniref:Lipoprotein LpqB n=1 Tax=Corynebacterium poyangense TaxID=2684405 RepID=A0A7H0SMJ2_9CORY|nr:MtrAB system accessory lipoprotein LpqB [Corynebacterium poyangense]QNQ89767.1 MtrAB system accessory protein LpqB [Corynebacterium poyangense]
MNVRRPFLALLCSSALCLAGCNSLPGNSEPQVLRKFESSQEEPSAISPIAGREPDLLVRDFYAASARPTGDYLSARNFMTAEASQRWNPRESTLVVNRIDLTTQPGADNSTHSYKIRGDVIGRLESDGTYRPENFLYEADVKLQQVDGEWRISSLPNGLVLERSELRNQYQPHELYYFDTTGKVLVNDRRWVYSANDSMNTTLVSLWAQGASEILKPAVNAHLPKDAEFIGAEDQTYRFSGLAGLDQGERLKLAAELVWTLSAARIPGPYGIEADGQPLLDSYDKYSTDDFAEYNPAVYAGSDPALYALTDKNLFQVTNNGLEDKNIAVAHSGDIRSAAIRADHSAAIVRSDGDKNRLWVGKIDARLDPSLSASSLTTPTFEYDSSAVWVVAEGRRVTRIVRSSTTGELAESVVDTTDLKKLDGDISVLRLSHDGTRAAFVVAGKLYTAIVQRPAAAERRLTQVIEIAPQLGDSVLAVDWQYDGSLVVGTSTPDNPVWRVELDGSAVTSLPSGNLTAPVVAVAASPSMLYVTDSHSTRQLPIGGEGGFFWREVPGLQGVRSALTVAN